MGLANLFDNLSLNNTVLDNRVVMAPMTRQRAFDRGVPTLDMAEYYGQRSSMGMLVSEGTYTRPGSIGYPYQPGAVTNEQICGWRSVFESVHQNRGKITVQLMDAGALAKPSLNGGTTALSSSFLDMNNEFPISDLADAVSDEKYVVREMNVDDIQWSVKCFSEASRLLFNAGADGIELHAANGYLLNQFLDPVYNRREDKFGGSVENRYRIILEIIGQIRAIDPHRILGLRLSPDYHHHISNFYGRSVHYAYRETIAHLSELVDYISIIPSDLNDSLLWEYRKDCRCALFMNSKHSYGETDYDFANEVISSGLSDAAVVGRKAIANPDLVFRWKNGFPLNRVKYDFFYNGGREGFTDYEFYS